MTRNNPLCLSFSSEETLRLGQEFAALLPPKCIIAIKGDLGAGKTTFIKGVASSAAGIAPEHINSPTFSYLNIYHGLKTIYHFDLYRLSHAQQFLSLGFEEYFEAEGICCIEWSERIPDLLPQETFFVTLLHLGEEKREIQICQGMP